MWKGNLRRIKLVDLPDYLNKYKIKQFVIVNNYVDTFHWDDEGQFIAYVQIVYWVDEEVNHE